MNKSEINYYDCCEGDTNDVYQRFILKGTVEQVEQYLKDEIERYYEPEQIEELQSDSIGFGVTMETDDTIDYEYYIEAYLPELSDQEVKEIESYSIEEYNKRFFYHPIIDLTENMEVLNQ